MQDTPLRSGTTNTDPGLFRRSAAERERIAEHASQTGYARVLPGNVGMIVDDRYRAFEGDVVSGPHLRIALCTGRASRLMQEIDGTRLEGVWRPGTLAIMPPGGSGYAASGAVGMIGLAIVPALCSWTSTPGHDRLHLLAGQFVKDAVIPSVLVAMRHEAAAHGSSSAFLEHGIAMILRRLCEEQSRARTYRSTPPISIQAFQRLTDYVASRLGEDVRVVEMAAVVGKDPSGFTRALRARTGLAPYAWLTERRMDHAEHLLGQGMPVTQVAIFVGYANAGKFASAFRRVKGYLPSGSPD